MMRIDRVNKMIRAKTSSVRPIVSAENRPATVNTMSTAMKTLYRWGRIDGMNDMMHITDAVD